MTWDNQRREYSSGLSGDVLSMLSSESSISCESNVAQVPIVAVVTYTFKTITIQRHALGHSQLHLDLRLISALLATLTTQQY